MGVSENREHPIVPNGFADHYPVFKWLFHWEYTPLYPMVLRIIIPMKNGYNWEYTPLYPMVLLIIIPMKHGYFIGNINPTCSDKAICTCVYLYTDFVSMSIYLFLHLYKYLCSICLPICLSFLSILSILSIRSMLPVLHYLSYHESQPNAWAWV